MNEGGGFRWGWGVNNEKEEMRVFGGVGFRNGR